MTAAPEAFRDFRLPLDRRVLNEVHGAFVDHPRSHDVILKLDDLQIAFVALVLLAVLLLALRRPSARLPVLAALCGATAAYGATVVLKPLVDRGKPYLVGRLAAGQHPGAVFPEGPGAVWVALAV